MQVTNIFNHKNKTHSKLKKTFENDDTKTIF